MYYLILISGVCLFSSILFVCLLVFLFFVLFFFFFFSSRRRHTRLTCDWSSDVCSSDLIFDMFYSVARGDRAPQGTGLGLAICRGMIGAHGGSVEALPGDGVGTVKIGRASCRERV